MDRRMSSANDNSLSPTTILLRKLPRNTTSDAVRTMLLFAKDLKDTEIVSNEYDDDTGFATAIARFSSIAGAAEARSMLDGKPNTAGQANMIVSVVGGPALADLGRRNTIDPVASRKIGHSVSPPLGGAQRSSRFNGTFQAIDKISPPMLSSPSEHPSESSSRIETLFSPQSPVANINQDRSRHSGKLVIGEAGGDDETGELLKDPLAYMSSNGPGRLPRQNTNPRMPTSAFAGLSLDTSVNSPSPSKFASPRSAMSPYGGGGNFTPTSAYGHPQQPFLRHNYPPVNPADQNPPCNTLYVGNLPIDTSEDELKALFSKQRGYKRLCFRTKQNGPMCFVEFEDVSFATKALHELYGVQLHNSVKGGIRLSFSKNPLGVRAGQPGGNGPPTPLSASGPMGINNLAGMNPAAFSLANGPPPGLSMPQGPTASHNPQHASISPHPSIQQINGPFMHQGYGMGGPMSGNPRGMHVSSPGAGSNNAPMYPDYMMGR